MTIETVNAKLPHGEKLAGVQFREVKETLNELDQALADAFENYVFEDVFANCKLNIKEMELCIISSLLVQNHIDQLDYHFNVSRKANVDLSEIYGVILHCIPFSGWPKGSTAIKAFMHWLDENNLTFDRKTTAEIYGSDNPDFAKLGFENGGKIYSDYSGLEESVSNIEEGLEKYVTEGIFGRFYGRNDLTLRLRQLTAVAILTSLSRLPQLKSHIKGALLVGCSAEEVREVIKLMHIYAGWPATLNALAVLNEYL